MTYLDFVETMKEEVGRSLCEQADVEVVAVMKNNGIKRTGLTIRDRNKTIAPTIYLEDLYQSFLSGTSETYLCNQIITLYREHDIQSPDLNMLNNYEELKSRLACRLVDKKYNQELLQKHPYMDFMDLALLAEIEMTDELANGCILIHNDLMKHWNITKEELIRDALENAVKMRPAVLYSMDHFMPPEFLMGNVLREKEEYQFDPHHLPTLAEQARVIKRKMEASPWDQLFRMVVLSNNSAVYGAATLAYPGVLTTLADVFESDFYILPSSVQEVILLPDVNLCDPEELKEMIKTVNETSVKLEERLSDSLYFFDRKENKLMRVQ